MSSYYVLKIQYVNRPPETRNISAPTTTIGRESGDIVLNDPQTSGRHAEILFSNGQVRCRDAGSTNGTWFNGQRLTEFVLEPGQWFQVGQTTLQLMAVHGAQPAAPAKTVMAVGAPPPAGGPGVPGSAPQGWSPPGGPPPGGPAPGGFGGPPPGGFGPPPGAPPRPAGPPPGAPPPAGAYGGPPPGGPAPGGPPPGGFGGPPPGGPPPGGFGGPPPGGPPPGGPPPGGFGGPPPGGPPPGGFGGPPPGGPPPGGFGGPPPGGPPPGYGGPPPGGPGAAIGAAAMAPMGGPGGPGPMQPMAPQGGPPMGAPMGGPPMPMGAGGVRPNFQGSGGELFVTFLLGGLLTSITLGIYYPWFMCKLARYVASNTTLGPTRRGELRLEFTGTGGDLFVTYLVGGLLTSITLGIYAPWFYCKLFKFFADNVSAVAPDGTRYRLNFEGTGGELFVTFLVGMLLSMVTLYIYMPWFMCKVMKFFYSHTTILENEQPVGSFDFEGTGGELFVTYLVGMLLTMVTLYIYFPWFQVKLFKFFAEGTRITYQGRVYGGAFHGTGGEYFVLNLVHGFLAAITLYIYMPWYLVKQWQFQLNNYEFNEIGGGAAAIGGPAFQPQMPMMR